MSGIFHGENGNSGGGEEENREIDQAEEMPPYIGELVTEANKLIARMIRDWQSEGKEIDLSASITTIRIAGADVPTESGRIGLSAAMKGVVGERVDPGEMLSIMAEALHNNCEAAGYQDPLMKGAAFEAAIEGFFLEVKEQIEPAVSGGWWGRLRWRFPSRKREFKVAKMIDEFAKLAVFIRENGHAPEPDDEESVEGLSRGDFEGES